MNLITKNNPQVGLNKGKFHPCPKTPNCVSTQASDDKHKIEPIYYKITLNDTLEKIISIIESIKRTKIITKTENYIHAEFRTGVFKFVDDVEFYFDDSSKIIHFRSASRVGHSDLGVNRKRMEKIRNLFMNN